MASKGWLQYCDLCQTDLTIDDSDTMCQRCEALGDQRAEFEAVLGMTSCTLFRPDNTDGYTEEQLIEFNAEFHASWMNGKWHGISCEDASKAFIHEVAHR